jgi:hypothetical protein
MPNSIRTLLYPLIALCVVACTASKPQTKVPPGIHWRTANGVGNTWNREQFIEPILNGKQIEGMTRAKMIQLFGDPGYTAVNYPGSSRIDEYRLSARNNRIFRVDYGRDGIAVHGWVEDGACDCPICKADAPTVAAETLNRTTLLKQEFVDSELTIARLEKQLGASGSWNSGSSTAGGQVWLGYSDTWRLTSGSSQAQPNRFFIADGHTPMRDFQFGKEKELQVGSWAIVTWIPGCMPE